MTEKRSVQACFWRFALSVYTPPQAREAFLRLQDRDGADVPLLFWCLWCGASGRAPDATTMKQAIGFSRKWRDALVGPVRALRRSWKGGIGELPPEAVEAARQQLAQAEQAIERLQMDRLATLVTAPVDATAEDAMRQSIAAYASAAALPLDPEDCATLIEAASTVEPPGRSARQG